MCIRDSMSASCLHYGIELFEGLKAFRGVDGKVRLFRVEDNARRLRSSAERLCLPLPTVEMVVNACVEVPYILFVDVFDFRQGLFPCRIAQ